MKNTHLNSLVLFGDLTYYLPEEILIWAEKNNYKLINVILDTEKVTCIPYVKVKNTFEAIDVINITYTPIACIGFSDIWVDTTVYICEKYNLPNIGPFASYVSTNKSAQRLFFDHISPDWEIGIGSNLKNVTSGKVIKKFKSTGGAGTWIVDKENSDCSHNNDFFLVENYIDGDDVSVEALFKNNELIFASITDEEGLWLNGRHFEMAYFKPSQKKDSLQKKLIDITKEIGKNLKCNTGILHIEFRVDSKEKIYLIEFACRLPGDHFIEMYSLVYNVSFIEEFLTLMSGGIVNITDAQNTAVIRFLPLKEGIVSGLQFADKQLSLDNNCKYEINITQQTKSIGLKSVIYAKIYTDLFDDNKIAPMVSAKDRRINYIFAIKGIDITESKRNDIIISDLLNIKY